MSDLKDADGGAAFPYSKPTVYYEGMSLRDYFAGMALQGLICSPRSFGIEKISESDLSTMSYQIADAMLQERMKPKP